MYKRQDGYRIEEMISELADFYGLSKQAVKMRIREMGYSKVDGAFSYVNGQYVTPFTFDASALSDNQSFTIAATDLFKAYCLNKEFRKVIDTGKFVYIEGHVCLNDEKYIIHSDGQIKLTQYALAHMDECCLVFDMGYSLSLIHIYSTEFDKPERWFYRTFLHYNAVLHGW